jgi:hypothetical protein
VPVTRQRVDGAEDPGREGSDRGGAAAKVGKEFHQTRVAFVPVLRRPSRPSHVVTGQAAVQ